MKKPQTVTVHKSGKPPLPGAEAFARLLAAAVAKRPELKVVEDEKIVKGRMA